MNGVMKVREWWNDLAQREKQAVSIGGFFVTLFILYLGIWKPALDHIETLRTKIVSDQKTLVWMQSADKILQTTAKTSFGKNKNLSLVMFLSLLKNQINANGLEQSLTQLKQSANETVEIHFQRVEFDKLMSLLIKVLKENPVTVSQLSVIAVDSPGFVNADILIGRTP